MDEKFYYCKNIVDKMEAEMKEKGIWHEEWSMMFFTNVANMGSILIELMGDATEKRRRISSRDVVYEQAEKCDFIDVSVWNDFFNIRNRIVHSSLNTIPINMLIQRIIPEFVKEFELLKSKDNLASK